MDDSRFDFFFLLCNLHHPNSTRFDTKLDSFLNCVPVHFPRKNSHILDLETEMSYLKLPHMTVRARRIATRTTYYICLYDGNGCGFSISMIHIYSGFYPIYWFVKIKRYFYEFFQLLVLLFDLGFRLKLKLLLD